MTAVRGRGNREGTNGLKGEGNEKTKGPLFREGVQYRRRKREEDEITRMSKEVIRNHVTA